MFTQFSASRTLMTVLAVTALLASAGMASATKLDLSKITTVDQGPKLDDPPSAEFGETPEEAAAKKTFIAFLDLMMIQRQPKQAFEKYVSKEYCNHSHLSTHGAVRCAGYDYMLAKWTKFYGSPVKPGELVEIPTVFRVNGEMVTAFGEGIDVFRVVNGKITDHWDASVPVAMSFPAPHRAPPPPGERQP